MIQKIIGLSLENVSGLLGIDGGFFSNLKEKIVNSDDVTSGVNVEVGKTQVAVDLNIIAEYQKKCSSFIFRNQRNRIFRSC